MNNEDNLGVPGAEPPVGPFEAKRLRGYGDALQIVRAGTDKAILTFFKPDGYFTDYPKHVDENGETWTICSTEAARKAGNYIATDEIKAAFDAHESSLALLFAAAPDLLAACVEFVRKVDEGRAKSTKSYAQMKLAIEKATKP